MSNVPTPLFKARAEKTVKFVRLSFTTGFLLLALSLTQGSVADEFSYVEPNPAIPTTGVNASDNTAPRKMDPRLPPVIPGEKIRVGDDEIKVWSTGGSPSERIEGVPQIPPAPGSLSSTITSVIVDQRGSPRPVYNSGDNDNKDKLR